VIIVFQKYHSCNFVKTSVYIPRTCTILAPQISSPKLSYGHQKIYVIAAYKILGHIYDGLSQTGLSVVVSWMFRHVSLQLGNFDLLIQISLEARINDFSLSRFETVDDIRYSPQVRVDFYDFNCWIIIYLRNEWVLYLQIRHILSFFGCVQSWHRGCRSKAKFYEDPLLTCWKKDRLTHRLISLIRQKRFYGCEFSRNILLPLCL